MIKKPDQQSSTNSRQLIEAINKEARTTVQYTLFDRRNFTALISLALGYNFVYTLQNTFSPKNFTIFAVIGVMMIFMNLIVGIARFIFAKSIIPRARSRRDAGERIKMASDSVVALCLALVAGFFIAQNEQPGDGAGLLAASAIFMLMLMGVRWFWHKLRTWMLSNGLLTFRPKPPPPIYHERKIDREINW